jgi:hypothetical protein
METKIREITLKLDDTVVDFLNDELRKKRSAGLATTFTDTFLIRLVDALNNKKQVQVFKLKQKI